MSMGIQFTPFQIETLRLLYKSGTSSIQIGQELGVSDWTVKKYCRDIIRTKSEALALRYKVKGTMPKTGGGSRQKARRLIRALGYRLIPSQHVHHKDGNPFNNELDNLEVMNGRQHVQEHNPPKSNSPWLLELAHVAPEDRHKHMKEYHKVWRSRPAQLTKRRERKRKKAALVGWRNV